MDHALSDVTVLDLGQVLAMPFCTMRLADLGARVITVESRERRHSRLRPAPVGLVARCGLPGGASAGGCC